MRLLKNFLSFTTLSFLLFACQKEVSFEIGKGNTGPAQWEFKEAAALFKGNMDTAHIQNIGGVEMLFIEGTAPDSAKLFIQVLGLKITKGTYKTPSVIFSYVKNGTTLYANALMAIDKFSLTITSIDSIAVSGTFTGEVEDTAKAKKIITDGKFTAKFRNTVAPPPPPAANGELVVWAKQFCAGNSKIDLTVNGVSKALSQTIATAPACGAATAQTFTLPAGSYTLQAKCGTTTLNYNVTVTANTCTKQEIDFANPPPPLPTGDYFPTTANSNWSYEDPNSPDTALVLSTGTTKTIGGKAYNIFLFDNGSTIDSAWYRKEPTLYYEYISLDASAFQFNNPINTEYVFLKDNVAAGTSWETPVNNSIGVAPVIIPIVFKIKTTIIEKAASATVNLQTYTDVIKAKTEFSYTAAGINTPLASIERWYARGKGVIKHIETDLLFGTSPVTFEVSRMQIY